MTTPVSFTIRPPTAAGLSQPSSRSASPAGTGGTPSGQASPSRSAAGDPSAPFRISAIPIRPSPLSRSTSAAQRGPPGPRYGRIPGSHHDAAGSDDDDDDAFVRRRGGSAPKKTARDEEIAGFGEDGIESLRKQKDAGPLVIPAMPNRDWRKSSMVIRKPTYVPESRATREVKKEDLFERTGDEPVQAGLQLTASNRKEQAGQPKRESDSLAVKQEDVEMQDGVNGTSSTTLRSNIKIEQGTTDVGDEDSIETRAMKALLMDQQGEDKKSDLVIALNEDTLDLRSMPVDETDAFRRDVVTRPTESTLDDYAATPIEAFGEALLRGMGWKPNSGQGPQIHVPKRRPDGLGLGASAKPETTNGSSGAKQGAKPRPDPSKRAGRGYVPVIKKERDTPVSSTTASRNGTPSRASSRSPDSRDSRDSKRRRDDRDFRDSRSHADDSDYKGRDRDRRRYEQDDDGRDRSRLSKRDDGDRYGDKAYKSSRDDGDRRRDRRDGDRKTDRSRYEERDRGSDKDRYRDKERDRRSDKH